MDACDRNVSSVFPVFPTLVYSTRTNGFFFAFTTSVSYTPMYIPLPHSVQLAILVDGELNTEAPC